MMGRKLKDHALPGFERIETVLSDGNRADILALVEQYARENRLLREERDAARGELETIRAGIDANRNSRCSGAEKLNAIAENSGDAILRLDKSFRLVYANPAAVRMMHTTREDLPGKTPMDMPMPMHIVSLWRGGVERVIRNSREEVFEYEFDDQRTIHYIRITMTPELGPTGAVESVLVITRDISDQKRTEVELRESEKRFRLALGASPVIVYAQNGSLRYTWAYSSHPDLPAERFLGHTDRQIYPKDVAIRMSFIKGRVMETGQPEHEEFEVSSDRGTLWLEVTIAPLRNNEGQIIGITGSAIDITRRKQSEEALRESEERFRASFENGANAMAITAIDSRLLDVNAAFCELLGFSEPELVGHSISEITYPDDLPLNLDKLKAVARGEITRFRMEKRYIRKDGRIIWTDMSTAAVRDRQGKPVYIVTHIQDVTERKETESALRRNEERFRAALDVPSIVLAEYDAELRYTWIHNPHPDIVVAQYLGKRDDEVDRSGNARLLIERQREVLESGRMQRFEWSMDLSDGKHFYDIHISPRYDTDGAVAGITAAALDITGLKHVEEALQDVCGQIRVQADELRAANEELRAQTEELQAQSEELLSANDALRSAQDELETRIRERTAELHETAEALKTEKQRLLDVLDMLPAYVLLLSPDYHVPFANRFFRERFGESRGHRCFEYLFNRREPCEICDTFKVLQNLTPQRWEWTGPDKRKYDIYDFPFISSDGLTFILEMGLDITERKLAEAELEQYRHHLEELVQQRTAELEAANTQFQAEIIERRQAEERIAQLHREQEAFLRHEVKNLFAPIQLFAELTLDAENLTGEQSHYLNRIVETAKQAAGFVDSMKRIHDIETGNYPLKRIPCSLDAIIRQVIQNLAPLAEKSGVTVQLDAPERELIIPLDPQLLPGVFINLIQNAIEHVAGIPDPGEKAVTVDVRKGSGGYIVRINNRGVPIAPDRLDAFFEKFNSGPEKKNGTGLGTTYACSVVRAHGGNIGVTSDVEKGTTVTVELPE